MRHSRKFLLLCSAMVIAFLMTGCGKTTVNLDKYITIETSGYDSVGTATYRFDSDAFKKDYEKKIKINKKKANEEYLWDSAAVVMADLCVAGSLDKTSGLSNGDTVTFKWNCQDSTAEEYFNTKLKYSDIEKKVSGLKDVGKFDPFEFVKVTFSGTSPDGSVTITPDINRSELQSIYFNADKTNGLKIGDTIKVTANLSGSIDGFVEKYGAVLEKTEETYTVEGLAHYITDISEVSEDMYNKMDKQLRDNLTACFADWAPEESMKDMQLLGNYMITLKDGMQASYGEGNNYIYYIYKVTSNGKEYGDFTYYWYGYFTDVMVLADGTCTVDLSSYTVPDTGWFAQETVQINSRFWTYGFADLASLFNKHVVSRIEKYEYKSTVSE